MRYRILKSTVSSQNGYCVHWQLRVEYITNVNLIWFCLVATRTSYFCPHLCRAQVLSLTSQSFNPGTKHNTAHWPLNQRSPEKTETCACLQVAYSLADYIQASLWIMQALLAMKPASKQVLINRKICQRGNTHIFTCWLIKYHSFLGLRNPGTCTSESQTSIQILWPCCLKTEALKS